MTTRRRTELASAARPLSAIYLGSGPNPLLPPLPSPPSPLQSPSLASSSRPQQLPSPPATNSTSSGSIGDAASRTTLDTLARHTNMSNDSSTKSREASSNLSDDENFQDDDNEDHTAKLSGGALTTRREASGGSTLARVRSLTERNRQLSQRLSNISRHNTPSPDGIRSRVSPLRLPLSDRQPTGSSLGTSRLSRSSFSGSETEREPTSVFAPSEQSQSPLTANSLRPQTPPPPANASSTRTAIEISPRQRLTSAPSSTFDTERFRGSLRSRRDDMDPGDRETAKSALDRRRPPSQNAFHTQSSPSQRNRSYSLDGRDNTAERRSPPAGKRPRQPLPKEFRQPMSVEKDTPSDPPARPSRVSPARPEGRGSPSPSKNVLSAANRSRPSPKTQRSRQTLTLREPLRAYRGFEDETPPPLPEPGTSHQRFPLRSGTFETGGRSIVGESLKAAGLSRRRDDDVFTGSEGTFQRRARLSGGLGTRPQLDNVEEADSDHSDKQPARRTHSRLGSHELSPQGGKTTPYSISRGSPSLARFQEERLTRTAPQSRTQISSFITPDRLARGESVYTPPTPSQSRLSGRYSSNNLIGRTSAMTQSEHTKLMTDSLSMFESHLARLPTASNASLSASTIPDLYRNAQNIVNTTGALNTLLREATGRALEEQIEAEIREQVDNADVPEIWRTVGSEYRESLRLSDELVRTMTGFLLGMGRVLREAVSNREPRIDGETRTTSPTESTERRSTESRRSLDLRLSDLSPRDPRERERHREDSLRRIATHTVSRASSVLSNTQEPRDVEPERPRPAATDNSLAVRRLFAPRSSARNTNGNSSEPRPSATQADRKANRRSLPLLASPTPLPSLPSESLLNRSQSGKTPNRRERNGSIATVRGAITSPQATTALTTATVGNAPERAPFPLIRTDSVPNVTFSRPTESAASGLQQQQEDDYERMRVLSTSSAVDNERMAAVISPAPDSRRRSTFRDSYDSIRDPDMSTLQRRAEDRRDRRRTVTEIFSR